MPFSVPAALLAVALAAALFSVLVGDLRRRHARPIALIVVLGAFTLALVAWLAALIMPLPVWIAWLASLPSVVVAVAPARLVRWTGGPARPAGLRAAVLLLREALAMPTLGASERDRLRRRVRRLDRFRTAETAEVLDLVAEAAYDRIEELPVDAPAAGKREAHIDALLDELDPGLD